MTYILLIVLYYDTPFAIQIPMENEKYCIEAKSKITSNKLLLGRSVAECLKVK